MGMLEDSDDTLDLKVWGVLPVKYLAEAIELEASHSEGADTEKINIMSVEIQEKADEMIKCSERIEAKGSIGAAA